MTTKKYKLTDDITMVVDYDDHGIARITKEALEELIQMAIEALKERKTEKSLIADREALVVQIQSYERTINKLNEALQKQKQGEWIDRRESSKDLPRRECSVCGILIYSTLEWAFCPNCGSRNRRDTDEQNGIYFTKRRRVFSFPK